MPKTLYGLEEVLDMIRIDAHKIRRAFKGNKKSLLKGLMGPDRGYVEEEEYFYLAESLGVNVIHFYDTWPKRFWPEDQDVEEMRDIMWLASPGSISFAFRNGWVLDHVEPVSWLRDRINSEYIPYNVARKLSCLYNLSSNVRLLPEKANSERAAAKKDYFKFTAMQRAFLVDRDILNSVHIMLNGRKDDIEIRDGILYDCDDDDDYDFEKLIPWIKPMVKIYGVEEMCRLEKYGMEKVMGWDHIRKIEKDAQASWEELCRRSRDEYIYQLERYESLITGKAA